MYRPKGFKINRKKVVFFLTALLIFSLFRLVAFLENNLSATFLTAASYYVDLVATEAINEAVYREVAGGLDYDNLVRIEKDHSGKIVMAQINTREVNRVVSRTTLRAQETLRDLGGEIIRIPLGQALGSYILANLGPRVPVIMLPVGRVNTNIIDSFEEAGINQTRHKIYLDIIAEVQVIVPLVTSEIEVMTRVPLAESLYQGDVPDTLINLQFSGMQGHIPGRM